MITKNEKDKRTVVKENKNPLLAIDLFSGCGGLTLGLKKAGYAVVGAIDIDPLSVQAYQLNHPDVSVWCDDIRTISARAFKRQMGLRKRELALLAGCPPCQGFSRLRTLNGSRIIRDARNNLLEDFLRFVKEFLPKAVMMENVPDLANDKLFSRFHKILADLGYFGDYKILDSAHYGVPQHRRRLIYIAGLGRSVYFSRQVKRVRTVRDAIGTLKPAGKSGDPLHDLPESRTKKIQQLIRKIPKNGGSRTDLSYDSQLLCHQRCNGFKDVYGRMAWDRPAPTITSGCFNPSKGRFLHPEEDRAITMREAALLQSFPKTYKFPRGSYKQAIALMIGNALPPELIRRHALSIRKSLVKVEVEPSCCK